MKRCAALLAVAAALVVTVPAHAWPPVCKPLVYDLTGICV